MTAIGEPAVAALLARGVGRALEHLGYASLTSSRSPMDAVPTFSLSARPAT
jgi:hypothetical protein